MNIHDLNKAAWDQVVDEGTNPYAQAVTADSIAEAKKGRWSIY